MSNYGDYHYFAYIGNNKNFAFRTYRDPQTGMERGYCVGKDKNGQPIFKSWQFNNESLRLKRVGKDEKDLNGQKMLDFLRECPACYRSVNGSYVEDGAKQIDFFFKEVDNDRDAKMAVETRRLVIEAQQKALNLAGQELDDIATLIGVFGSEEIQLHRVLDFSANKPGQFMAMLNDPARQVRGLIRRAVHNGILKQDGRMISWDTKTIGSDEDEAVATLMKDEKLQKAVEANLKKFGQK